MLFFQNTQIIMTLFIKDKNYSEESKYIEKVINKFAGKRLNILELGCGSGNHAFYLKKRSQNSCG